LAYVLLPPASIPRLGTLNRGMKVKAFDNMPGALEWLELSQAEMDDVVRNG